MLVYQRVYLSLSFSSLLKSGKFSHIFHHLSLFLGSFYGDCTSCISIFVAVVPAAQRSLKPSVSGCHRRWQLVLQLVMGFPKSLSHWAHGRYNDGHALADRDLDSGFGLWILIIVTSAARSSLWSYVASCGLQMVQSFCSWDARLNQEVRHEEQPGVPRPCLLFR